MHQRGCQQMGPAASPTGRACRARQDPTTAGPRNNSPSTPKHCVFRPFWACRANYFTLAPTPGRPGHKFRAQDAEKATLKPTTPLLAPNTEPLKPASPLHPQTAPKTPHSHPQRRRRFQSHTDTSKHRRSRFQSHTGTSEQRRRWFQTTGPSHLQHPDAAPAGEPGCDTRGQRPPWAATTPPPAKCRTSFIAINFRDTPQTLRFQRYKFNV